MADKRTRAALLRAIAVESKLAAIEVIRCKRDILYWFDHYAITYDPRINPATGKPIGIIPFELYEFQREAVLEVYAAICEGHDLIIDKSRDMGITWVVISVYVYCFLFMADFQGRVGSRNVNEVDKPEDIGTLFGKMRIQFRKQPNFLKPVGYNEKRHSTFCRMFNPATLATIIGETANPSFGRSARNTSALFDEMAFWENDDRAWESCGQTTPCRLGISTPNGMQNRFGKMANRKIPDCPKKLTYHWTLHPLHNDEWYEFQKTRYTKSGLAREVDISYSLSVEGAVIDMFDYGTHVKNVYVQPGSYNPDKLWVPDPSHPIIISFDFGLITAAALFGQVDQYYNVDVFHEVVLGKGTGTERQTASTEDLGAATIATIDRYNRIHPYRKAGSPASYSFEFCGDPAGQTKPWQTNEAFNDYDVLDRYQIRPIQNDKIIAAAKRLQSGMTLMQTFFSTRYNNRERILLHNPDKIPLLIQALQGEYKYKTDRNNDTTNVIEQKHPYEDVMDTLRYMLLQFADILPDFDDRPKHDSMIQSPYTFPV